MPRAKGLLRFYPRAWRQRYGEELLELLGEGRLGAQQTVDVISGAIDAWLSADVRRATGVARNAGGSMMLKSMIECERGRMRASARDAGIGAAVMMVASLVLTYAGAAARQSGWPLAGEVLTSIGFPVALMLSLPFWLMKGQPWRAQVVIVGGTIALLAAIGWLAALS